MRVYITARGQYQVQNAANYCTALFDSLLDANSYIRSQNQQPIYTWFNN